MDSTLRFAAAMGAVLALGVVTAAVAPPDSPGSGELSALPESPPNSDVVRGHEVWLVDQSDTAGTTAGGTIHIYQGRDLRRDAATAPSERIDLGAETLALCMRQTGAPPVRPHMLVFSPGDTHGVLSFVASGHVVFFDASTREPLTCLRTEPGVGGVRQAHAIWPTPDGEYVLVANQNGKLFERIATDYATDTFVQQPNATLDLANGTTPNGFPREDPELRPDNAPICPFVPDSGFPALVSLRGGGLFAIDPYTTPMTIVAEYTAADVHRDGCGFVEARGWVYGNAGGGNPANLDGWFIYRLPIAGPDIYTPANPPGEPAVDMVGFDDGPDRDAHGVAATQDQRYVWMFDRAANLAEVFTARDGRRVGTVGLVSEFSDDPTPDLIGESPDGRYLYASLRGPNPLSGDPHASTGSTPGLLVIELLAGGRTGVVRGLAPITNVDSDGMERADAHGIRVRVVG